MSVGDNSQMGAYRRHDSAAVQRSLDRAYGIFPRLGERRRQLAGSLSGGERQMCAMARALIETGEVVLSGAARELVDNPAMRHAYLGI